MAWPDRQAEPRSQNAGILLLSTQVCCQTFQHPAGWIVPNALRSRQISLDLVQAVLLESEIQVLECLCRVFGAWHFFDHFIEHLGGLSPELLKPVQEELYVAHVHIEMTCKEDLSQKVRNSQCPTGEHGAALSQAVDLVA